MIKIISTEIEDVKVIEPLIYKDDRGYFFESFNQKEFHKKIGQINFVQVNESKSSFGVLRGLHFQKKPYEQSKLVRVIKGKIQDVAVDIRKKSPTYLKYISVFLSEQNKRQLFIPKGFAHAFLVLSDESIVSYKVDNFYNFKYESGIRYDDLRLKINWELGQNKINLSKKDKKLDFIE